MTPVQLVLSSMMSFLKDNVISGLPDIISSSIIIFIIIFIIGLFTNGKFFQKY